jgi:hypothetical protein
MYQQNLEIPQFAFDAALRQHYFSTIAAALKALNLQTREGVDFFDADETRRFFAQFFPEFAKSVEQMVQADIELLKVILAIGISVVETIVYGFENQSKPD